MPGEPTLCSRSTYVCGKGARNQNTIIASCPLICPAPDAKHITFGFLLTGAGIVWGDDLKIEVVGEIGQGPDTTGIGREQVKVISEANRKRKADE